MARPARTSIKQRRRRYGLIKCWRGVSSPGAWEKGSEGPRLSKPSLVMGGAPGQRMLCASCGQWCAYVGRGMPKLGGCGKVVKGKVKDTKCKGTESSRKGPVVGCGREWGVEQCGLVEEWVCAQEMVNTVKREWRQSVQEWEDDGVGMLLAYGMPVYGGDAIRAITRWRGEVLGDICAEWSSVDEVVSVEPLSHRWVFGCGKYEQVRSMPEGMRVPLGKFEDQNTHNQFCA